jgi:hypothetical protein
VTPKEDGNMLTDENNLILRIEQALRGLQEARSLENFATAVGASSGLFSKVIREIAANKGHGRETRLYNFRVETLQRLAAGPDQEIADAAHALLKLKLKVAALDGDAATRFWRGAGHFSDIELHARRLELSRSSADIFLIASYLAGAGSLRMTRTLGENLLSYPAARTESAEVRSEDIENSRAEVMWRTQSSKCWLFPMANQEGALPEIEELYGSRNVDDWIDLRNAWVLRLNLDRCSNENLWHRCLACAEAGVALQFVVDVLHAFELFDQLPNTSKHAMLAKRILPVAALWRDRADENLHWRTEALYRIDPHVAQHLFDWSKQLQCQLQGVIIHEQLQEHIEDFSEIFGDTFDWGNPT